MQNLRLTPKDHVCVTNPTSGQPLKCLRKEERCFRDRLEVRRERHHGIESQQKVHLRLLEVSDDTSLICRAWSKLVVQRGKA